MDKKIIHEVVGNVTIVEIPYEVTVPVYVKKEMPEYELVKKEIEVEIPKVIIKEQEYEKPVIVEKSYEKPVFVEKIYEIPKYVEKIYEVPKLVEKVIEVPVYKFVEKEQVNVIEVPYEVKVPKLVTENVKVINAVIEDKQVVNAVIKHVTVEALHPRYLCSKCKKEVADEC